MSARRWMGAHHDPKEGKEMESETEENGMCKPSNFRPNALWGRLNYCKHDLLVIKTIWVNVAVCESDEPDEVIDPARSFDSFRQFLKTVLFSLY